MHLASKFKIRCSAISEIMAGAENHTPEEIDNLRAAVAEAEQIATDKPNKTNDKTLATLQNKLYKAENPALSQGAKTYCQNWYTSAKWGKDKLFFGSKYTKKGTEGENDAIDLYGEFLNTMLPKKNEVRISDAHPFLTGECDLLLPNRIDDIKCSWDIYTFPRYETQIDKGYEWQLLGYMAGYSKRQANVVYCLVNAPYELIDSEIDKYCRFNGCERTDEIEAYVTNIMTFDDMPINDRVKVFPVLYDAEKIALIEKRVQLCREYIATL